MRTRLAVAQDAIVLARRQACFSSFYKKRGASIVFTSLAFRYFCATRGGGAYRRGGKCARCNDSTLFDLG